MRAKINIALASSYEYARYARVLLMSLFATNPDYEIDVYYMYLEADEKDITPILAELNNFAETYHNHVIPLKITDKYLDNRINVVHWHPLTYARHAIYHLLPDQVDRIMLMGIDMLVLDDIGKLYFKDMEDNYFLQAKGRMGILFPELLERRNRILQKKGCGPFEQFYNGDLLVADVSEMKKMFDYTLFLQLLVEKKFRTPDEDALNYLFHDHIGLVDWRRWNYVLYDEEKTDDIKNVAIIHFTQKEGKAWANFRQNEIMDLWWKYAKKTEYYTWYLEQNILITRKLYSDTERELKERLHTLQKLLSLDDVIVSLGEILQKRNIKNIAVYGYGSIGKYFIKLIENLDINIVCIIDNYPDSDLIMIPETFLDRKDLHSSIDAIIVTSAGHYNEIITNTFSNLKDKINIVTLADLL